MSDYPFSPRRVTYAMHHGKYVENIFSDQHLSICVCAVRSRATLFANVKLYFSICVIADNAEIGIGTYVDIVAPV